MKKTRELRGMNPQERNKQLEELKKELMQVQAQAATGTSPKNPGRIRSIKRTLARIYTLENQKEETKQA